MRIVTITVSRNEADILETFVRHHAAFVHRMVIFVHRCSDNTLEIAEALVREGLPVEVHRYDDGDGEVSDIRMAKRDGRHTLRVAGVLTRAMHDAAARLEADWVVPLDTDEFLTAAEGSAYDILAASDSKRVLAVDRPSYVPTARDDPNDVNVLRRIVHRRTSDLPPRKALVPGALAAREDYRLSNGSHVVLDTNDEVVSRVLTDRIFLAHFPVRSDPQLRAKVIGGYLTVAASPLTVPSDAHQWRRLFARCSRPEPLTREELGEIALFYPRPPQQSDIPELVRDPIPTQAAEIRYPIAELEPWQVLVDSASHLAEEVNRLATLQLERDARRGARGWLLRWKESRSDSR